MLNPKKIGLAIVGPHASSESAVRKGIVRVLDACDKISGLAPGEALLVLEVALLRVMQSSRAQALADGGVDAFDAMLTEQRRRLQMLESQIVDDSPARYADGRWLGPTAAFLARVAAQYSTQDVAGQG